MTRLFVFLASLFQTRKRTLRVLPGGFQQTRPESVKPGDEIALHGRVISVEIRTHPDWKTLYLFSLADGGLLAYPARQVVTLHP